jgi:hypothetical protein
MEDVITRSVSPKTVQADEDLAQDDVALTQDDVDRRIRAIDIEMEATERRIAQIDLERQEHERQIQILHSAQIQAPRVSDIKSEMDTEEDVDTETLEEPLPKETRVIRKRPRPISEIEDRENIRVRIWRKLKSTKFEDFDSEEFNTQEITVTAVSAQLNIIERVEDLPDFQDSEKSHRDSRHAIFCTLRARKKREFHHKEKLRRRYQQRYITWQAHMDKLDAERDRKRLAEMERRGIAPPKPEPPMTMTSGVEVLPGTPGVETTDPLGTRGTRRAQQAAHARDYVQSEAEFLELMASLGTEEKDPTAKIPPMLPPDERDLIEFDESALVHDPVAFYTRGLFSVEEGTKFDLDGWTDEEDKVYLRRLSISGKQFGRFRRAAPLQNRSVQELVQHYYFLKGDGDGLDWRNVIAGKNRYGKGGQVGRPSALIGSGALGGKPRGSRGRGRGRGGVVPLLQRMEDEDDRSIDDDGEDSGVTERVRRGKKRIIDTAAKQRPKRTGPLLPKEKVGSVYSADIDSITYCSESVVGGWTT